MLAENYSQPMTDMSTVQADPDKLKTFGFNVFTQLSGAVTAGMIHLGDRLGLFVALADADAAITTIELANRTGLSERWVREWAYNQAAARLLEVDDTAGAGNEKLRRQTILRVALECFTAFRRRWQRWTLCPRASVRV